MLANMLPNACPSAKRQGTAATEDKAVPIFSHIHFPKNPIRTYSDFFWWPLFPGWKHAQTGETKDNIKFPIRTYTYLFGLLGIDHIRLYSDLYRVRMGENPCPKCLQTFCYLYYTYIHVQNGLEQLFLSVMKRVQVFCKLFPTRWNECSSVPASP